MMETLYGNTDSVKMVKKDGTQVSMREVLEKLGF